MNPISDDTIETTPAVVLGYLDRIARAQEELAQLEAWLAEKQAVEGWPDTRAARSQFNTTTHRISRLRQGIEFDKKRADHGGPLNREPAVLRAQKKLEDRRARDEELAQRRKEEREQRQKEREAQLKLRKEDAVWNFFNVISRVKEIVWDWHPGKKRLMDDHIAEILNREDVLAVYPQLRWNGVTLTAFLKKAGYDHLLVQQYKWERMHAEDPTHRFPEDYPGVPAPQNWPPNPYADQEQPTDA